MASDKKQPAGQKFALESAKQQALWQVQFRQIVADVQKQALGPNWTANSSARSIGLPLPRNDVLYKVRGTARYAANISMDGMLYGRFARSQEPHARILNIDVSAAARAPGVHAILTADDILQDRLLVGTHDNDTPILAKDRVRYVGEPIVAIVAESVEQAQQACDLVEVEYESLPVIFTPEEAITAGAYQIDAEAEGNIITEHRHAVGDVDAAFAAADIVLENTFTTEPIDHCFLEAQAGLAFVDSGGTLNLLVSTQYPHFHHEQLARVTGLPMEKIRVIQTVVGGAFGGKIDDTIECASCLLALKTSRPVSMTLTREEVFIATTKRHRLKFRQKLAATRKGHLTALELDILCDGGAYRSYSRVVAGRCVVHAGMPYRFPNLRVHFMTAFTNHVPSGSMRSFGVVKMAFALESHLTELAAKIGISPIEIRKRNGFVDGDATSTGQVLQDVGLLKTLAEIEPVYERRKRELAAVHGQGQMNPGRKRGLGVACLGYGIGYSGIRNPSTARLAVSADGFVTAFCGTPDIGTGSDMALTQIAAEALDIDLGRLRVVSGDSTKTDDSGPTSASRTTYFSGNAVCLASEDFKRQFCTAVAEKTGCLPAQVRIDNDRVIVRNEPLAFEQACRLIADDVDAIVGYGKFDPDIEVDISTYQGNAYPTYTYGTHLVEIEVDEELGSVDVVRYWAAHDGGVIVNPIGAEGQVEGGIVQGLGMALWEKIVRQEGFIVNPHYRDYLLPGAMDSPGEINVWFVETYDRTGPFGAKGLAEASIIPAPGAIAGAISDAVGVWPRGMPMESEKILELMGHYSTDAATSATVKGQPREPR